MSLTGMIFLTLGYYILSLSLTLTLICLLYDIINLFVRKKLNDLHFRLNLRIITDCSFQMKIIFLKMTEYLLLSLPWKFRIHKKPIGGTCCLFLISVVRKNLKRSWHIEEILLHNLFLPLKKFLNLLFL